MVPMLFLDGWRVNGKGGSVNYLVALCSNPSLAKKPTLYRGDGSLPWWPCVLISSPNFPKNLLFTDIGGGWLVILVSMSEKGEHISTEHRS